jgi:hypothetical protein
VSSQLRLVTAGVMITFAGVIGVGALALVPRAIEWSLAKAGRSDLEPSPCNQQAWLTFDRSCLTRRDLPWVAGPGIPNATEDADNPPNQSLVENNGMAGSAVGAQVARPQALLVSASPEPVLRTSLPQDATAQAAAPQDAASPPPIAAAQESMPQTPVSPDIVPQKSLRHDSISAASPPIERPQAVDRSAPKAQIAGQARPPAPKKVARQQTGGKRSTTEDSSQGRTLGDKLQDIPVTRSAADGTPRTVVIRPTSVQDSYYYSSR